MSVLKVDAIQDTSGNDQYTAKAWLNMNGTGTVAIRDSGNISSITDAGSGTYTASMSNSMGSANYSLGTGAQISAWSGSGHHGYNLGIDQTNPTTSTIYFYTASYSAARYDASTAAFQVFE